VWLGADDIAREGKWIYTETGTTFSTLDFDWYNGRYALYVVWVDKLEFLACARGQLVM